MSRKRPAFRLSAVMCLIGLSGVVSAAAAMPTYDYDLRATGEQHGAAGLIEGPNAAEPSPGARRPVAPHDYEPPAHLASLSTWQVNGFLAPQTAGRVGSPSVGSGNAYCVAFETKLPASAYPGAGRGGRVRPIEP